VIRGDTPHFDVVVAEASKGIAAVARETGVPVIFGVLTTDTMQQALERAGIKSNLGWSYGLEALEMGTMLKLLLGDPNARKLKRYQPLVSDITLLEEEISPLSDDDLRRRTAAFQERLANAGTLENQRPILDEFSLRLLLLFGKPVSVCWACATSMCN